MKHDIETGCPCSNSERDALRVALAKFPSARVVAPRADQQRHWRIHVYGSGAVLRDVVTVLDRAGFLD